MSTLWTPEGEHPVRARSDAAQPASSQPASSQAGGDQPASDQPASNQAGSDALPDEEAARARLDELRRSLADTPVEVVIANHAYGLFELAALHLSSQPPSLEKARLATDAMGALVEGMSGRLGESENELASALAQIRLAFVHIANEHAKVTPDPAP